MILFSPYRIVQAVDCVMSRVVRLWGAEFYIKLDYSQSPYWDLYRERGTLFFHLWRLDGSYERSYPTLPKDEQSAWAELLDKVDYTSGDRVKLDSLQWDRTRQQNHWVHALWEAGEALGRIPVDDREQRKQTLEALVEHLQDALQNPPNPNDYGVTFDAPDEDDDSDEDDAPDEDDDSPCCEDEPELTQPAA